MHLQGKCKADRTKFADERPNLVAKGHTFDSFTFYKAYSL